MGAVIVLLGVALMIIIHEGGHFVAAKAFGMKATDAFFGFGPKLWSTKRGETEYGLRLVPLGGYVRIIGMNPFEEVLPEDEGRTYRQAPFWQKSVTVLAGIASHFVVALVLFFAVAMVWGVIATDDDGNAVPTRTISQVPETTRDGRTTPSSMAGAASGDVIVAFNGTPTASWDAFTDLIEVHAEERVVITVERNATRVDLEATLITVDRPVEVDGEVLLDSNGEPVTHEVGFFGVTPQVLREDVGFFSAFGVALTDLFGAMKASILGLWQLILGFPQLIGSVFGGSDDVLNQVRPISPIGLAQIAGPRLESSLVLLALVNVFVGMLNLVPLYPLDGGHFAVAAYEKLRGRAPDVRKLMPVAAIVFLFLVTIGLLGLYFDIVRPIQ